MQDCKMQEENYDFHKLPNDMRFLTITFLQVVKIVSFVAAFLNNPLTFKPYDIVL